jgi:hypothetical protein
LCLFNNVNFRKTGNSINPYSSKTRSQRTTHRVCNVRDAIR